MKKIVPVVVIGGVVYLLYKAYNLPQANARPVNRPVTSPPVYDHMYTDAHLTDVSGGQGG